MPLSDTLDDLRRRTTGSLLDLTLRTLSSAGRWHPQARPLHEHVKVVGRDVPYLPDGSPAHRLDVIRPRSPHPETLPVVLYLHGGGFRILSKETHWMMAGSFATRGYLVFNANYRLSGEAPFPAAVEDATAALEWVLDNAAHYGGDPERLVLAGESAGANLATALTVACCFRRPEAHAARLFERGVVPRATVPLCGMLEVSRRERFRDVTMPSFARDRIEQVCSGYLCERVDEVSDELDLANPLCVLERPGQPDRPLPAFAASVGTSDPVMDDTVRLERALAARGIPHHVSYHHGEPHAFQAFVWRREARRAWDELFAFLEPRVRPPAASKARAQPVGLSPTTPSST